MNNNTDRMFVYIWYNKHTPNECKFGETWVASATCPMIAVTKRVKNSLGVNKHDLKDGTVQIHATMDVTDLAKQISRLYKHSRMDDYIRSHIGFRKGTTGDHHTISASEMEIKVNEFLKKQGQALAKVCLSQNQHDAVVNVRNALAKGKKTIVAELCPRFGKTIWSLALASQSNTHNLVLITSYCLSSFSSFKKELANFQQFKDFVVVDASSEEDYKKVIKSGLSQGKKIVVFLSMCNGENRQDRIDYLFGLKTNRMLIVDEADYGVHKSGQCDPLIEARKSNDIVILMTGTGADRAVGGWEIDHYLSVTYPELLLEKKEKNQTIRSLVKGFSVDPKRHDLVVGIECYQMNMMSVVDRLRKTDTKLFVEDGIYLPSWSKFAANPMKAKGFFINVLQAVFDGKGGDDSLNADYQTRRSSKEGSKVAMGFVSGSTTKENLLLIKAIAEQALPKWCVVLISGAEGVTNAKAEALVKENIETAKKAHQSVFILSAGMAQRSFSVPEIDELYLMYDGGDLSPTTQKISRALTPDEEGKIGRIISLSFDPSRDDKFDSMILETAKNYNANKQIGNLRTALGKVLTTLDIFRCLPDGAIKMEIDDYLDEAMARNSIDRVIGKTADLHLLTDAEITALAQGNFGASGIGQHGQTTQHGKTRLAVKTQNTKTGNKNSSFEKAKARVRELVTSISENFDILYHYCGGEGISVYDILSKMDKEPQNIIDDIETQFGVDYSIIKDLISRNVVSRDLLSLKFVK